MAGDYETIINYNTEDAVLMPDFISAIRGKEAITKIYERDHSKGVKYHSISDTPEKRWMVGDEVFDRGTFGLSVSSGYGKPDAYYGSYFHIWQKDEEGN